MNGAIGKSDLYEIFAELNVQEIDPRGRVLDRKLEQLRPSRNICATNSCEKVGRRQTAKMDRAISMTLAQKKM